MRLFKSLLRRSLGKGLLLAGMVLGVSARYVVADTVEQDSDYTLFASADITLNANDTFSFTLTGYGPYDGIDDVAIDVINNSSNETINGINLTGDGIFDFDGDGIGTYISENNSADTSFGSYAGPGANYFTNLNTSVDSDETGTIVFGPAVGPGGTSYFSLEAEAGVETLIGTSITQVMTGGGTGVPEISSTGGGSLAVLLIGSLAMLASPKAKRVL
jgi:hypothetical protein